MCRYQLSILGAAVAVALLAVTACATQAGTPAAVAATRSITCKQLYQAWRTGPANAAGRKLDADADAIGTADSDVPVIVNDLKNAGADAAALEAYPMPECADPAGYWLQYLAAVKAAGDNAGSASGLAALLLAAVPLKQVPAIQAKLNAELGKTVDVKVPLPLAQTAAPLPTVATVAPVAIPSPSAVPTLATIAPATMPAPSPLPTLATLATVPVAGS